MARRQRGRKGKDEKEKARDTNPTVFTAAGLLAFSEEEAVVKIRPIHVMGITIAFILAVILATLI